MSWPWKHLDVRQYRLAPLGVLIDRAFLVMPETALSSLDDICFVPTGLTERIVVKAPKWVAVPNIEVLDIPPEL